MVGTMVSENTYLVAINARPKAPAIIMAILIPSPIAFVADI